MVAPQKTQLTLKVSARSQQSSAATPGVGPVPALRCCRLVFALVVTPVRCWALWPQADGL